MQLVVVVPNYKLIRLPASLRGVASLLYQLCTTSAAKMVCLLE